MDTDALHTQLTNTVPCTRCAEVEVPAPESIEDDPVCETCARDMIRVAAGELRRAEKIMTRWDRTDEEEAWAKSILAQ